MRGLSVEELRSDLNARDALLWNMTVIGEATSQLPDALRARFPDVPWRAPIAELIQSLALQRRSQR